MTVDQVFIDGQTYGVATVETDLPAGSHNVKVAKEGYAPYETTIHLKSGDTLTVNASLERLRFFFGGGAVGADLYVCPRSGRTHRFAPTVCGRKYDQPHLKHGTDQKS
ncbi:MAG: PEGA domain-containing protein [SAR324 cluster bacterium]|nr:PEGA domain-containing protein [SAR324 cluster bacterium]